MIRIDNVGIASPHSLFGALVCMVIGVLLVTLVMHAARGIARGHARLAKALLVTS
jgi:hypothetical protein